MNKKLAMSGLQLSSSRVINDSTSKQNSSINRSLKAPRTTKSLRLSYTNKVNPPETAGDRMPGYL